MENLVFPKYPKSAHNKHLILRETTSVLFILSLSFNLLVEVRSLLTDQFSPKYRQFCLGSTCPGLLQTQVINVFYTLQAFIYMRLLPQKLRRTKEFSHFRCPICLSSHSSTNQRQPWRHFILKTAFESIHGKSTSNLDNIRMLASRSVVF